jgi:prepilin peptidase dependent protein B
VKPFKMTMRRPMTGMSIVEMMIGITIGLFILAGSAFVMTSQVTDNRKLLLEAQLNQDLRAVAIFLENDLRRANYYGGTFRHVWASDPALVAYNPYNTLVPASTDGSSSIKYARSLDDRGGNSAPGNDAVDAAEMVTVALNTSTNAIDMTLGNGSPQALTDSNVVKVTDLSFRVQYKDLPVPCGAACPVNAGNCRLTQRQRIVSFKIIAQAVHDPSVKRSMQESVRLRNDVNLFVC